MRIRKGIRVREVSESGVALFERCLELSVFEGCLYLKGVRIREVFVFDRCLY